MDSIYVDFEQFNIKSLTSPREVLDIFAYIDLLAYNKYNIIFLVL